MSYVANKDGGANEVFFFPAAFKNNQKGKFKMKKITVFIVSFLLILSTMSVFMISAAEPIAPAMPDNAVAVLDKDGISNALGDNAESTIQGLYGRHYKRGLTAVDFSSAEYVEFDAKFSNFNAIKEYLTKNNATIEFCLTSAGKSSGDVWVDRSTGGNIMNYMVSERNGWHHFSIPKSAFKAKFAAGVDWTKVDTWLLIGEGAGAQTKWDSHYSEKITIANICGTVSVVPALPSNAVITLDEEGISKTLGDNANWQMNWYEGRFGRYALTPADFSNAENIEFDIRFSNYNAFKAHIEENNISFQLFITSSGEQIWPNRSGIDIMSYATATGNGWYHYTIPKSAFIARDSGGVNWSAVDSWFLFGENCKVTMGDIYSDTLTIANICGTVSVVPALPSNAVITLDEEGISKTLGDNANWQMNWYEGRFGRYALTPADFSNAENIEFDIRFSNYNAFKAHIEENNISFQLFITSSGEQIWPNRSGIDIMSYATATGNGWYHYTIPKSAFIARDSGGVNWSAVDSWFLFGENCKVTMGDIYSDTLTIANICGTCDFLISDIYDLTDGYVLLNKGTTVADIIGGFNSGAVVYDEKGLRKSEGKIYGGMTVSLVRDGFVYDNVITVIKYDLDNDGDVSSTDLVILRKFLLGLEKFTNAQNVAVKGSITGEISVKDLVRMKKNIG